ncbi:hypothetical protein LPMP_201070 [Leishmania panamensis]|uniref:Uncharacterized protein n=1 Tax=Leishmania panamensis TaxID=5679 RepID=A0A088RQW6_LEIPA|nr:hypothetical protein LPMP_201070 [Leishmania panamensis]AIN97599.1 hypothetical protein LPMP_201070 [Leishmania panamensis]
MALRIAIASVPPFLRSPSTPLFPSSVTKFKVSGITFLLLLGAVKQPMMGLGGGAVAITASTSFVSSVNAEAVSSLASDLIQALTFRGAAQPLRDGQYLYEFFTKTIGYAATIIVDNQAQHRHMPHDALLKPGDPLHDGKVTIIYFSSAALDSKENVNDNVKVCFVPMPVTPLNNLVKSLAFVVVRAEVTYEPLTPDIRLKMDGWERLNHKGTLSPIFPDAFASRCIHHVCFCSGCQGTDHR